MADQPTTPYRLGLDLGTNSIGWAAVRLNDQGEPFGVLDMGVRVFPDGRDAKSKESNAVTRRVARGARRRRDRYQKRRADLLRRLTDYGLMPADEGQRRTLAAHHDPYKLRARALDDPLSPHELGRALFHLNQRRGFKSNRKADQDSGESGVIKEASEALEDQMAESDARTLGEFLDHQRRAGLPTRFRNLSTGATAKYEFYPTRQMLLDEFDQIRAAQAPQHNLNPDQWDELRDYVIFFQRPLKPVEPGWCQFEANEPRAARALPVAQEFRLLQEVNNLRIRVGIDPERRLNSDERVRALERLRSGKDINLAKPTRDLKLPSQTTFNLSRGGRTIVKGDETTVRLTSKKERGKPRQDIFGDRWSNLSLDQRNQIVRFMLNTDDPVGVQRKALADWGLNETQAKVISDLALPDGYSNLSEKAIRKLLPHLERGLVFSDAVQAAGYKHHSDFRSAEAHASLPYYGQVLERDAIGADPTKDPEIDGEPARYGRFPNPTVHIGLNQLRRVVNRLIDIYGKPEDIVVELARDLKWGRKRKDDYRRRLQQNEKRNQQFEECLRSAGQESTPFIRQKLRLWEEQGPAHARVCLYTGRPLSFGMVASSQTEIDHILPFSQTLNDSLANKVVCTVQANRDKGDRSPYEAFGNSPPGYDYEEILARAATLSELPDNKRWRFEPDAMQQFQENRDFLDRQLNETSYLSRTACKYLAHLYDEKTEGRRRVRAIPGHVTSKLRRGWCLEGMLRLTPAGEIVRKQRDDHRHHAIDAFVVANTTQGLLQRFAQAAGSSYNVEERLTAIASEALPWDGFTREDLQPLLDRLVVSYKPDHGTRRQPGHTTGQLHNETAYGLVELSNSGPSEVVVRKPLTALKRSDLVPVRDGKPTKGVRDLALRAALFELWVKVGGKAAEFAERAATEGVRINGRVQRVRRVRLLDQQRVISIRDARDKPYKGYLPGGNEFADVWRMRDGSWRTVAVPTFDANQPAFDIEMFRPSDKGTGRPDPAAKRLMRLHIDDLGALGEGQSRRIVRLRKITNAKAGAFVVLDDHNEANVADRVGKDLRENRYSSRQLQRLGYRKVGVNEIGRIRDPGPFKS